MPPAAKKGDQVVGVDTHIVLVSSPGGPIPTPLPHPFAGQLDGGLVSTVTIGGAAVAVKDSTASNQPHIATPPGVQFQTPPADEAKVILASATVTAGGSGIARMGDVAETCGDPAAPAGTVIAAGTVLVGG